MLFWQVAAFNRRLATSFADHRAAFAGQSTLTPVTYGGAEDDDQQGFRICPYTLDLDHWHQGFITV